MAERNVIILAGIPACGKSTVMQRMLPKTSANAACQQAKGYPRLMGRVGGYYHTSGSFLFGGTRQGHNLSDKSLVIHWSFASCTAHGEALTDGFKAMAVIEPRVEAVLLLVCSYQCFIRRYWESSPRRKLQFRHATNPEQIIENYGRFSDGCKELGLTTHIVDTTDSKTDPGKLLFTKKSIREVLSNDTSLERGAEQAVQLLEQVGIEIEETA